MAQNCDEGRRVLISMDVNDVYSKLKVGEGWIKPDIHLYNQVKKERTINNQDKANGKSKEKDRNLNVSENISKCHHSHRILKPRVLKDIEAYYINDNFKQSSLSLRKLRLNEEHTRLSGQYFCNEINNDIKCCNTKSNDGETMVYDNESACACNQFRNNMSNTLNIHKAFKDIKAFRKKYFFECHSADTILNQKINTIRDVNHKCQYDFYLNDRLFLIPKCSDNLNQTRCSSCYLPVAYELRKDLHSNVNASFKTDEIKRVETLSDIERVDESVNNYKIENEFTIKPSRSRKLCDKDLESSDKQNGIIEAKISLNPKLIPKDIVIELPVKMSLVVKEKWPNVKISEDVRNSIGVIRLDNNEVCVKSKYRLPKDSYALKYQKGYTELKKCKIN